MSENRLPQEIIDYILDLPSEEPETLKQCCLVSRSWVPRARTHLFRTIIFRSSADARAWKMTFPVPQNSPGSFTCTLRVRYREGIMKVLDEGGWIQSFPRVTRFEILTYGSVPSLSQAFKLICSLPLLEDLEMRVGVVDDDGNDNVTFQPSSSPPLTGTLMLHFHRGLKPVVCKLLDLPSGIRFQRLNCGWFPDDDPPWITALVERCAETLKYVDIECSGFTSGQTEGDSIDLSKATRLREVVVRLRSLVIWACLTLKTLTSEHKDLRRILIYIRIRYHPGAQRGNQAEISGRWRDVDETLVQLWESNAVATRVMYTAVKEETGAREYVELLLPEMRRRGIVELVDCSDSC